MRRFLSYSVRATGTTPTEDEQTMRRILQWRYLIALIGLPAVAIVSTNLSLRKRPPGESTMNSETKDPLYELVTKPGVFTVEYLDTGQKGRRCSGKKAFLSAPLNGIPKHPTPKENS